MVGWDWVHALRGGLRQGGVGRDKAMGGRAGEGQGGAEHSGVPKGVATL